MATVLIGSARIDERGKASGGQAGDQTGKEVSTQNWYDHSKGWIVLRPKDGAKAQKIAKGMRSACDNPNIGYDQTNNQSLWNLVKDRGFDPAKADKPCETDCARLVRVCCAYAGIMADDFYTATEATVLMRTGEFIKLTDSKYTDAPDYLGTGDILVTRTKGHTVVVLSNGKYYDGSADEPERALGDRILRDGDYGADVAELQTRLKAVGYDPGEIDGEFGPNTESAVKALQTAAGILVDGEFGPDSLAALAALEGVEDDEPADAPEPESPGARVAVSGGNAYIRTGPGTQYDAMGVAHAGDELTYANPDGWAPVLVGGRIGWISGKYAKVVSE